MGVLLVIGFLVSLNYLIHYNSIDRSSSSSSASESSADTTTTIEQVPCNSGYVNKDVFCVNNEHNYVVKFDRDYTTNHCKIQPYKAKLAPLPRDKTKKNLFILSIGSNHDFIKRMSMQQVEQNNSKQVDNDDDEESN